MTKLALPDVTLVMVTTVAHELSRMALEECTSRCDFADVLVFSDKKIGGYKWGLVGKLDLEGVCRCYWYEVPTWVDTSHFLIIQYDSWVINTDAWSDNFLEWDYVGAPWWYGDSHNVGNGGFSLRLTELARRVAADPDKFPFAMPEDDALCRRYGPELEKEGFCFAPTSLAMQFSYERVRPFDTDGHPMRPFGFHGAFNWPDVLTDGQIAERLDVAPDWFFDHVHYKQMVQELRARGRTPTLFGTPRSKIYAA